MTELKNLLEEINDRLGTVDKRISEPEDIASGIIKDESRGKKIISKINSDWERTSSVMGIHREEETGKEEKCNWIHRAKVYPDVVEIANLQF